MKSDPLLPARIERLYRQYGDELPRADAIGEKWLGWTPATTQKKIRAGQFPLQVVQLGTSRESPYLVPIEVLARYIGQIQESAA